MASIAVDQGQGARMTVEKILMIQMMRLKPFVVLAVVIVTVEVVVVVVVVGWLLR